MIAQPSRRVDGTPEPAPGPTPFADAALDLRDYGLAPVPLGGADGKATLVKWRGWKRLPGRRFLERLPAKLPTANVGVLTSLSGVTVVDIDDVHIVGPMVTRFGDTPLKTRTPSGGVHLWYKANGERCRNLRNEDIAVDIKGVGSMVVVPPSVRRAGEKHAGKAYTFLDGSWDDLRRLPTLKPGSLHSGGVIGEGDRNRRLFAYGLQQARHCDDEDALIDVGRSFNDTAFETPLPVAEVVRTMHSAWTCQV